MSGNEKSTDPGLSAAERKTLRSREAEEPIAGRMKELRRHFMKSASGCEKNVSGGKQRRGRCFIQPQSSTSDFTKVVIFYVGDPGTPFLDLQH